MTIERIMDGLKQRKVSFHGLVNNWRSRTTAGRSGWEYRCKRLSSLNETMHTLNCAVVSYESKYQPNTLIFKKEFCQ